MWLLTTNKQEQEQGEKEEEEQEQEQQIHDARTLLSREIYYGLQSNEESGFTAFVRNTIADTGMKHISCLSL